MLIVFIRAIILYLLIILSVRLMGKRQIGELQPTELAVTILISNLAVLPIEDTNIPLLAGAVPILAIVGIEILISYINLKNRNIRKLTSGSPVVIIKDGELLQNELKSLRFSVDDVFEGLRSKDIFDISEVNYAIVETNGKINVIKKGKYNTLTAEMANINQKDMIPPVMIICDGVLLEDVMKQNNIKRRTVNDALKKNNIKVADVFIMLLYNRNDVKIITKEDKNC